MKRILFSIFLLSQVVGFNESQATYPNDMVVIETDFGTMDGAVASMRGVMMEISPMLKIFDLSNQIEAFDIEGASLILDQSFSYWPKGTTFLIVVDPGVGTDRYPIAAKSKNGYYFVCPDNGVLSYIDKKFGIESVRKISPEHRSKNDLQSYTFDGRDLFARTAAKIASGSITFEQVGEELSVDKLIRFHIPEPKITKGKANGFVNMIDPAYGNIWTNIPSDFLYEIGTFSVGAKYKIEILSQDNKKVIFSQELPFCKSFGEVRKGDPLLYVNSLNNMAIALNEDNFRQKYNISRSNLISVKKVK